MKFTRNINRRGRRSRIIAGAILVLASMGLLIAWLVTRDSGYLIGALVAFLVGGFMIFEGAIGWCAVRAMGFETRL